MAERGRTWTDNEIKALLEIWGNSVIQRQLKDSTRTQGYYSWSQGMGILGDKVQESQEFVTFLPTSLLFICKRGNASLHSAR